jgi:WD40 repeat protein
MDNFLPHVLVAICLTFKPFGVGQRQTFLTEGENHRHEIGQRAVDFYGDPLPDNAIARLSTLRLRVPPYNESLAFTPDGKNIISTGWGAACLWDPTTGQIVRRFETGVGRQPVRPISLSRDGKLLAVGGQRGMVFEVATGRQLYTFGRKEDGLRPCLSPDGRFLAAFYTSDFTVEIYNGVTGKLERSFPAGDGDRRTGYPRILGPVFTPDSKLFVTVAGGGQIRVWNPFSGIEQRSIVAEADEVTNIALSPDGSLLASTALKSIRDKDGTIRGFLDDRVSLWDVPTGKMSRQIDVGGNPNWSHAVGNASMAFGPDGKTLWTSGRDGTLQVWDVASRKELRRFSDHRGPLGAIAFAPDGKTFAVTDAVMAIRVREVATGRDLVPPQGHRNVVYAIAVCSERPEVATGGLDRTVYLWDPLTGRQLRQLADKVDVSSLTYSKDDRVLFTASYQTLRALDLASGKEMWRLEAKEGIGNALALSPNGKILASLGHRFPILLIDPKTGRKLHELSASGRKIWHAAITKNCIIGKSLPARTTGNPILSPTVHNKSAYRWMGAWLPFLSWTLPFTWSILTPGGSFAAFPLNPICSAIGSRAWLFRLTRRH